MDEIFHCGYPEHVPEDLRRIAERLDATVVDIRYSALTAEDPRWSGTALRETLGDRYVRCIALADHAGCDTLIAPFSLIDFTIGAEFLRQIHGAMILLCGCREARNSHRASVARRLWAERRWDSRELEWEEESEPHAHASSPFLDLRRYELAHRF